MSKQDRAPRLADYVRTVAVQNYPGQVIMSCRDEGCAWTAQALSSRIGAELAYAHVREHGIILPRAAGPAASADHLPVVRADRMLPLSPAAAARFLRALRGSL